MKLSNLTIEFNWAFIFILFTLLWLTMERGLGFHNEKIDQHAIVSSLFVIPAILIYLLGLLDKRKRFYHGIMPYKQGVMTGLIITACVALFVPVSQSIISFIITPDYFANATANAVNQGMMTQKEAEANFNLGSYIIQGMIGTLFIGTATSLILGLLVKKGAKTTMNQP